MPPSGPSKMNKMFPAATLEDQEAIMVGGSDPVVVGIPPFSSPQPHTDGHRMVSIEGGDPAVDDENKKADDWKKEVKAASTEEALADVEERYKTTMKATGKNFSSVPKEVEKQRDRIKAAAEEAKENEGNGDQS